MSDNSQKKNIWIGLFVGGILGAAVTIICQMFGN